MNRSTTSLRAKQHMTENYESQKKEKKKKLFKMTMNLFTDFTDVGVNESDL